MAVLRSLVTTLGLNAAQFRSELKRSRDDFTSFGGSIVTGAKAVAGGVQATIAQIFSLRSALIALGSGAALAGIKAAYSSLDQTAQLGRNVGIAAQQWHAYAQAAEWAGSSSERLADVIKDLNVKIADAAKTGGGPMADFFKQIGQSAQSWAALSPDEQLRRFTAELQKMSASDARFWLDELNDAAAELFDTLYTRNGELLTFADSIEAMGMALTGGQFAAVRDARLELDRLVSVIGALWQQVKASMAPAVAEGSRLIRTWITDSAEAKGGFAELGKGIALYVIDGVEQASRALQALMQWVDQTINKIEPLMNESMRAPYLKARADLFAARVDYNEAEKAFIAASSDEGAAAPAFGHLAQMGEALSQAEERVKSFLNIGESNGWDGYFKNLGLLRQKIAEATTAGDGEAPLPAPGAGRPVGVVAIPDAPKASKKAKAANYAAVDSFREETAQIARELSKRQELLENSNAALAGVDQRWYDARAVQAQEAYGASIIEEASRWQDAQARLQQQYASAYDAAAGNHELQMQLQMERYGARELLEQDHQSRLLQIENDRVNKQREYQATVAAELLTFTQQQMSITTSAMQQAGMEQSALYKVLFAAQKAAAIPSMIVATEDAATKALGAVPAPYSIPLAASVKALGYASIGVVAGQTLAGMFDKGGYIPANQFGIVSELGDEFVNGTLVRGPANVTSRRESAAILDRAAGRGQSGEGVTIIQHISVTGSGDEALANAMRSAAEQGAEAGAKRAYQMVVEDVSNYGQIRRVLG
ncbi:hypothetical protein N5D73_18330 [Aeromonas caviae]|uniref:Phage tail tape measure protein n=1 Tax=Aeromonas caviae TaxID=648 RepID=A0AA42UBI0_AERCA|nr:hypothetical protein [Aeromonas caviae]MDH1503545.1 hypothetical protein [Aeromonas caviae]MDH1805963.1 hypothetical protein [Aeromonas caviae]MEA9421299.1 hypothetical protein [Aeromonas caviae]